MGMIMQIFTPNYFATNVIENCGLLHESVFSSNWYELETIEKKAALLFMTRTIRPFTIWAGNFSKMNINAFLKVSII